MGHTPDPASGSLPARACGAMHPCGKATNPPSGGWRRRSARSGAAGWPSMRSRTAIRRSPRPLTASLSSSPRVGSRRASARPRRAWTRVATARRGAVRAPVRGFGGCAPVRSMLRQRRGRPGVQKGGGAPSPDANVQHWVGWLSPLSGPWGPLHHGTRRGGCGQARSPAPALSALWSAPSGRAGVAVRITALLEVLVESPVDLFLCFGDAYVVFLLVVFMLRAHGFLPVIQTC